jgi:lambda repressor-like predicted transcriptional regulator
MTRKRSSAHSANEPVIGSEVREAEIASSSLCRAALTARAAVSCAAVRHHGPTLAAVARHPSVSGNSIARALRRAEKLDSARLIAVSSVSTRPTRRYEFVKKFRFPPERDTRSQRCGFGGG